MKPANTCVRVPAGTHGTRHSPGCLPVRGLSWQFVLIIVTAFFLCPALAAQDSAALLDRQIILQKTQATLGELLDELATTHHISFSYEPELIPVEKKLTLESGQQSLSLILDRLFEGTGIRFTEYRGIIILSKLRYFTVSGFIEDGQTGERLIGATIVEYHSQKGAVSNNYGFFSLTLGEGEVLLAASYVGYQPENLEFILAEDTSLTIRLTPGAEIEEVAITSENLRREISSSEISVNRITISSIKNLPTLLGEGDVLKTMQFLPGIQYGSEASSGLVVRGGSPEQNLILLDGAPIYNSNHAFGLFSVFNSDAIKNVTLMKGGFPARYGGRLSSVIDVRMKEGNTKEYHGSLNLGTIASKFTLEGPLVRDRSSFIITGRRTYVDLLLPQSGKVNSDFPGFYFYDINSKLNYQFSQKDRLYFSFYLGNDRFYEKERYRSDDGTYIDNEDKFADWGNRTSLLRWNHVYHSRLFSNLSLLYSTYGLTIDIGEDEWRNDYYKYQSHVYNSGIKDASALLDFDYYPGSAHQVKFGTGYIHHRFNPGTLRKISEEYYYVDGEKIYPPSGNMNDYTRNDPMFASEVRAFAEDEFVLLGRLNTNIGVHYSGFIVDGAFYNSLEPRLSASYPVTEVLAVKGAYSRMKQYIHLLTHSGMGLPTDLWLPVTPKVKPQFSNQYTAGMVYVINNIYKLNVEAYYKSLHQIYEYKEGTDYLAASNTWEDHIEMGKGRSYGIEYMVGKHTGKLEGWLSYTWSRTRREFELVNGGREFPYKYDRTHQATVVMKYDITDRLSANASWIYATGMAYTLATEKYVSLFNLYNFNVPYSPSGYIDAYKKRNNARMPDYHRLDISLLYTKRGRRITQTANFSVYNVYNRFNPYLIYWDNDHLDTYDVRKLKHVALFTVIPSLSYKLEF